MLRWINAYIEENQEKWDKMDLIKAQEQYEKNEIEEEQELVRMQEEHRRKKTD